MRLDSYPLRVLVHTGDGIGSVRNLSFQRETKNGDGIAIVRSTETESTFPFSCLRSSVNWFIGIGSAS